MDTILLCFILLLMASIVVMGCFMEMRYKKKISILEKQLKDSAEQLRKSEMKVSANHDEIRLLKWQIAHPPKYKKGDKFDLWIITSCELHQPKISDLITKSVLLIISICAGYFPRERKWNPADIYWEYELTHTANGEKKKMSQSQLDNFKPEA